MIPPYVAGAIIGAVIGYFSYLFLMSVLEPRLRATDHSKTPEERADFERRIGLLRTILLVAEVGLLGAAGFVIGQSYTY
jgi:hypothetical protein